MADASPTGPKPWLRGLLLIVCLLLVPIVPFVIWHAPLEHWLSRITQSPPGPWTVAALVVGLLSTDVFLPIPSSLVSTLAGGQLSTGAACLASWIGLNLGAGLGFAIGRTWGRSLAERLSSPRDLQQMESLADRYAASALVLTRALPILAEAMVLLLGVQRLAWRRFWPPVVLSNLGIAIAYSALGRFAGEHQWLPLALSISVAFPLLATWAIKRQLTRS